MTNSNHDAQPPTEHEFSAADDALFTDVARSARFVGVAGIALGALLVITGAVGVARPPMFVPARAALAAGVAGVLAGGAAALAGRRLLAAARELGAVAETRGRDVTHLVSGVRSLRASFAALAAMLLVDVIAAAFTAASLLPRGG